MRRQLSRKWVGMDRLWWILAAFCVGLFLVYILSSGRGVLYLWQVEKKSHKLQKASEGLLKENKELRENIERIKTDRGYQEEIARRDLGLVRPNEVIYSFENEKKESKKKR